MSSSPNDSTSSLTPELFLESALVIWVRTFCSDGEPLEYTDLCDGVFLNDVMLQIDPRPPVQNINRNVRDSNACLQNWQGLLKNIKYFYQEYLQQMIVMKPPNIVMIAREPEKEQTILQLKKVLLLLLGCAVQGEKKELYIETIKELDITVQEELVDYIKEITDRTCNVFPDDIPQDDLDNSSRLMYGHLRKVIKNRDDFFEALSESVQERDYFRVLLDKQMNTITTPHKVNKQHLAGELSHYRSQMKSLQEDLEEKGRRELELKANFQNQDMTLTKLKIENDKLHEELANIGIDKNDLDILQEQASRAEELEVENFNLKQKVAELKFYKARVEELREDNSSLIETRTKYEEQLETLQRREARLIDELVQNQIQLDDMKAEREKDFRKSIALQEEIARLEREKSSMVKQLSHRTSRLSLAPEPQGGRPFSEELDETMSKRAFELEVENECLQRKIDELKKENEGELKSRLSDLRKEKNQYQQQVTKLQTQLEHEKHRIDQANDKVREFERQSHRLEDEIVLLKDSHEHYVETLQMEIKQLEETCMELRSRDTMEPDQRTKYIQQENIEMFKSVQDITARFNRIKYNNHVLQKSCDKLKDDVDKNMAFSGENEMLRRENYDLRKLVSSSRVKVEMTDDLEKDNLQLQIKNKKMTHLIRVLKTTLSQVDPLNRVSYHYVTSV